MGAQILVQTRDPGIDDPDLGWTDAGPAVQVFATEDGSGNALWKKDVTLPQDHSTAEQRIVISELERFTTTDQRLVFTDVVHV